MTNEERIQHNKEQGYHLVASFDGYEIYKKENGVGGWTYLSDKNSIEGFFNLWDTALNDTNDLLAIYNDISNSEMHITLPPLKLIGHLNTSYHIDGFKPLHPGHNIYDNGTHYAVIATPKHIDMPPQTMYLIKSMFQQYINFLTT